MLRKKNNQISVFHVVHHGIMPMSVWFCVRFTPGGHALFVGMITSSVHILMYLYYMLSSMGPEYAKFIKWKKYLTTIQLVQGKPLVHEIYLHLFFKFYIFHRRNLLLSSFTRSSCSLLNATSHLYSSGWSVDMVFSSLSFFLIFLWRAIWTRKAIANVKYGYYIQFTNLDANFNNCLRVQFTLEYHMRSNSYNKSK